MSHSRHFMAQFSKSKPQYYLHTSKSGMGYSFSCDRMCSDDLKHCIQAHELVGREELAEPIHCLLQV